MRTFFLLILIIAHLFAVAIPPVNINNPELAVRVSRTHPGYTLPAFLFTKKTIAPFAADPVVTSDSANCTIPFSRAGNLIIIKAKIDTIEGNFVLDTGAPNLILNMTYFRDYPAAHYSQDEPGGITGTVSSTFPANISNLSFGPVKYYKLEADRINLGHIEDSKGIKILGLLGLQLFKQFEMIIDYEKRLIYLHLITRKERGIACHSPLLKDTAAYSTCPVTIMENKLLTFGYMPGKKLTFVIDTGAESNVLDSRLPNKVFENISITRRIMLAGTGSKKVEALYGFMKVIKIGKQDLTTLPILVTNLEKMCDSYNRCIDGILGFDFLSLQKIGFNFVSGKMYIWK